MKGYAKAQQLSKEILDDITEYNLYATRQLGVISSSLPKAKSVRQNSDYQTAVIGIPKTEALSSAGIDIRRANEAEKLAELPEEQFAQVISTKKDKDELSKTAVMKEIQSIKREAKRQDIILSSPESLSGKFDIIYADPPWQMDFGFDKRAIANHYPTMTLDEIKSLKIPAEENAVLYLWATAPKLLEALEVMLAWGFTYRSQMVWDKEIIGMGYWVRGQHEILLIGTKGNFSPPPPELRVSSVYREKRTTHSKKPDYYCALAVWACFNLFISVSSF